MADFPSIVNTQTSSRIYGIPQAGVNMLDVSFLRSVPSILMMTEIVLGLIHWALIASVPYSMEPAYGWVMFVAVTLWLFTIILFLITLFRVQQKLPAVPWRLMVMVYHSVATVLYLTAFLTNAATVHRYYRFNFYEHLAAASFFGASATLAYGVSAFLSYLDWKGARGNTTGSTVPT